MIHHIDNPNNNQYANALREFATRLFNKLYPAGGWSFVKHPNTDEEVDYGQWPHDYFSIRRTIQIPDGRIVSIGYREPIGFPNHHAFALWPHTPKLKRLPEELCGLPDLHDLNPSADAIQKAAQVLAEA